MDKQTPFEVQLSYSLVDQQGMDPEAVVEPVLNALAPTSDKVLVPIELNCGSDEICQPDFKVYTDLLVCWLF